MCTAQPAYASLSYEQFQLKNGLTVVVIPNHRLPIVSHMVWYKVGSKDEPPGESGIAHFQEHLMFKGTKNLKDGEFSSILEYYGIEENAFTNYDCTVYHQLLNRKDLWLVMMMEADRMQNLSLSEPGFSSEKKVVLEERASRIESSPHAQLMEKLDSGLFGPHPYGIPVIGWRPEIEKLTIEQVNAFHAKYYQPGNAVVVLAGDITLEDAKTMTEKYYGGIKGSPVTRIDYPAPVLTSHSPIEFQSETVNIPQWVRLYRVPSAKTSTHGEYVALLLLAHILGDPETGILQNELVEKANAATHAIAYYDDFQDGPSTFGIQVTPKAETVGDDTNFTAINDQVTALLRKIAAEGVGADTLLRAKTSMIAESIYAQDSISGMARLFGEIASLGLPYSYITEWEPAISRVDSEDIRGAAVMLLNSAPFVTGHLMPKEKDATPSPEKKPASEAKPVPEAKLAPDTTPQAIPAPETKSEIKSENGAKPDAETTSSEKTSEHGNQIAPSSEGAKH